MKKRIVIKAQGADGEIISVILNTADHYEIMSEMEKCGLLDYKILDWRVERVLVLESLNIEK